VEVEAELELKIVDHKVVEEVEEAERMSDITCLLLLQHQACTVLLAQVVQVQPLEEILFLEHT
jgi:hypothetical protein